ncbi:MAG: hypothetical protein UX04_C0002G0210 [Microgenomates group bacterium GW2011_GWF2_45_18]|nr:MAG: hypothetical protein UW18_C0003G0352 [Microgenomates group bacterium GW2011_GWF1_44_10]KKU02067.1 MAG: hypothetical protein UX04_C0002G0210 [Microgenomates group bacterium GW2011_GWF2_45_18]
MNKNRIPFNALTPELIHLAKKINFIEAYYKTTTTSFGMNDGRRKAQRDISRNMLTQELKALYILVRNELEKLNDLSK